MYCVRFTEDALGWGAMLLGYDWVWQICGSPVLRKRSSEKDSTNDYKNKGKIQTRMKEKFM